MPAPGEKLADALEELHGLQEKDLVVIKSAEISRVNRELLVKTGYLKELSKGWYTLRIYCKISFGYKIG